MQMNVEVGVRERKWAELYCGVCHRATYVCKCAEERMIKNCVPCARFKSPIQNTPATKEVNFRGKWMPMCESCRHAPGVASRPARPVTQ